MQQAAAQTAAPIRPELTLPDAEAALLASAYADARVILEYGSGGSTVMASEMEGKTVTSVESDGDWAQMMRDWLAANPPARGTRVEVIHADIGPTKKWGYPVNRRRHHLFPHYPLGIWQDGGMTAAPEVVLVDGRFRMGCALATAFNTKTPVDLYWDDYRKRRVYHAVEKWLGKPELTGRMAHFRIEPQRLDPRDMAEAMSLMLRPE